MKNLSERRQNFRPTNRLGVSPGSLILPAGNWPTVLDYLAHKFPHISPDTWRKRMARGDVLDDAGLALPPDNPYQPHAAIYYYRDLPAELPIPFEETVLYQDKWIVVADKPHFLPVTPSGRFLQETLLTRLRRKLGIDTLSPAHRIDLDTAGLVLFTVQQPTRNAYQSLFRDRTVEKHYEAIAPLIDTPIPAIVRSRIQTSASFMQMQIVEGDANAETHIAIIEHKEKLARYRLRPVTGQKHQLRVQMAALGAPIENDRIYPLLFPELPLGTQPDFNKPLQLLAKSIAFTDPITGERRYFESTRCLSL